MGKTYSDRGEVLPSLLQTYNVIFIDIYEMKMKCNEMKSI